MRPIAFIVALLPLSTPACADRTPRGAPSRTDLPHPLNPPTAPETPNLKKPINHDHSSEPLVQTIGQSRNGAPIQIHVFGKGPDSTLIFAGIHGDERNSTELAELLIDHLKQNPAAVAGRRVAIIPRANPDGLSRNTRGNAAGVDLNRNFPASNWRPTARGKRHGPQPASEPETQALIAAVDVIRPARIISIHAIHGGRECNNYDGPARNLAERMTALNGYATKAGIGYPTPGSFGTWAGIDRKIPTITLELPRGRSGAKCWPQQRAALLAVIAAGPVTLPM